MLSSSAWQRYRDADGTGLLQFGKGGLALAQAQESHAQGLPDDGFLLGFPYEDLGDLPGGGAHHLCHGDVSLIGGRGGGRSLFLRSESREELEIELKEKFADVLDNPVMLEIMRATSNVLSKHLNDQDEEK